MKIIKDNKIIAFKNLQVNALSALTFVSYYISNIAIVAYLNLRRTIFK